MRKYGNKKKTAVGATALPMKNETLYIYIYDPFYYTIKGAESQEVRKWTKNYHVC